MRLRDLPRHLITLSEVAIHQLRYGEKPTFTFDWTTPHRDIWLSALATFRNRPVRILEVGSFEGRTARFFLDSFPLASIACVDTFSPKRSAKFDHNVRPHRGRVTKLAGRSAAVLDKLISQRQRYDVIYIDGDHSRSSVHVDSALAWHLLNLGGVLIWDDYRWEPGLPSEKRPQHAIDVFCQAFGSCIRDVHRGYQVIIEKTADWPPSHVAVDGKTETLIAV